MLWEVKMSNTKMNNTVSPLRELSRIIMENKIYQKYEETNKCSVRGHPWDSKEDGIKNTP